MSAKDTGAAERTRSKVQRLSGLSDVPESVEEVMQIENEGLLAKDDTRYEFGRAVRCRDMTWVRFAPSGPSLNTLTVRRIDLASIVKPGIFIVDDVALPPPITFLVLFGEKAIAVGGGGLGLASCGPRVGQLSETGSDNDDRKGQSGDERLQDASPSIVHQRRRRQPSCTFSESRSGKGSLIPRLAHTRCVSADRMSPVLGEAGRSPGRTAN
jgi:hypothetical protein